MRDFEGPMKELRGPGERGMSAAEMGRVIVPDCSNTMDFSSQ